MSFLSRLKLTPVDFVESQHGNTATDPTPDHELDRVHSHHDEHVLSSTSPVLLDHSCERVMVRKLQIAQLNYSGVMTIFEQTPNIQDQLMQNLVISAITFLDIKNEQIVTSPITTSKASIKPLTLFTAFDELIGDDQTREQALFSSTLTQAPEYPYSARVGTSTLHYCGFVFTKTSIFVPDGYFAFIPRKDTDRFSLMKEPWHLIAIIESDITPKFVSEIIEDDDGITIDPGVTLYQGPSSFHIFLKMISNIP